MEKRQLIAIEVAQHLANKTGLTLEQVKALLTAQAELAHSFADRGFAIPGIGLLKTEAAPEREMIMQFGPKKGQRIAIPAKRRLKFHTSKLCKDKVFGSSERLPDLFARPVLADCTYSTQATKLSAPSAFVTGFNDAFTSLRDGSAVTGTVYQLPNLRLPTGRIVAMDPMTTSSELFSRSVAPGEYPVAVVVAELGGDRRVALALMRFSESKIEKWEPALTNDQANSNSGEQKAVGYGVDSAKGCFCEPSMIAAIRADEDADFRFYDRVVDEMTGENWLHIDSPAGSMAVFHSGYGDGRYPSYFGLDAKGKPVALVTDFKVVKWR
jgi:nucleoid DNA-binding protein